MCVEMSAGVETLVAQFLDAKTAKGLSPKTITTYRERLARFSAWLGDRSITRANLRAYLADLQREPLSKATVAAYFRDVKVFCGWLVEEEILTTNPTWKLGPKVPKRLPASYTPAQIARLLDISDARDRAIMLVLLDTGIRAGELCGMRRNRLNLTTGEFTVIGKGDKERFVALDAYTVRAVKLYLGTRTDDHPALWMGRIGPLTRSGVLQMLYRRTREAGIRQEVRRCTHAFRATFAKLYLQRGGDLGSLADLLGHTTLEMAKHYGQLVHAELAEKKRRVNPLRAVLDLSER